MKSVAFAFLLLLGAVSSAALFSVNAAHAVTGADWKAGRIIDDGLFYDNQSMSQSDIQNFLNSKVQTCDTQGTQSAADLGYPNMTHAQYAAKQGWPGPPYICLKDYYQVPRSDAIVDNYSGSIPTGAWSAAQIIKNAADTYGISPKALLVTLQKESPGPLLSDTWPLQSQYRNAMGYGCPDTAPCDPSYAGFYNQMSNAAYQFKLYKNNPANYRYKPNQNNSIYYNPNTGCGASNVYIETYATAGLYNYTPYQPNQAALNNLYGSGDGCSAYGNRNFWRIWNDWFGSTIAPSYAWELQTQYVYTDQTKTQPTSLDNLAPGQRVYVGFTAKNTGSSTWTNAGSNPVKLGTSDPQERLSQLYDPTWSSATRPAILKEASVAPGEIGTFEFWIKAPTKTSDTQFREYFTPLAEGKAWMPDIGLFYSGSVQAARYTWSVVNQYAYADAAKTTQVNMNNLLPGQRVYVGVTAKNTGNMTWMNTGNNAVMIGTAAPLERSSMFAKTSSWLTGTRPSTMKEASVAPGQTGTFEFWLTVPDTGTTGIFNERFNLIANDITWMNDVGLSYYMNIQPARYTWSLVNQYAYTDASKSTVVDMNNLTPGQQIVVGFTAKNTGNMTWKNSGPHAIMAGTAAPFERTSKFSGGSSWLTSTRPVILKEASVAPGQIGTFDYLLTVPSSGVTGIYNERFDLIANDLTWMNDVGLSYYMNIR